MKNNIIDRIDSISIIKNGNEYGYEHWYKKETMIITANEGDKSYPIAYIHKPKHISIEDWEVIKEKMEHTFKNNKLCKK